MKELSYTQFYTQLGGVSQDRKVNGGVRKLQKCPSDGHK